ncbi:MAG: hypothetical protein GX951_04870 [Mollicutes bacterium]|nr:hypothetical protein [Mollicutes bacterium]
MYCVKCGVKLKKSLKRCPLCNTPVIMPINREEEFDTVYSKVVEELKHINYNYVGNLINLVLIVLALIVLICDIIITRKITWSIYVLASLYYFSCFIQYFLRRNIYLTHFVNLLGMEVLFFVIAYLNNGMSWYLFLVSPFILILWLYIFLFTLLIKRKKGNILRKFSVSLLFSSYALMAIESCIDLYKYNKVELGWSIYASLPITIISAIIFIISYNKKLFDEIKQRLFI